MYSKQGEIIIITIISKDRLFETDLFFCGKERSGNYTFIKVGQQFQPSSKGVGCRKKTEEEKERNNKDLGFRREEVSTHILSIERENEERT